MPELPEVEVVLQQLRSHILKSTIHDVHIKRSDIIRTGLASYAWYQGARLTHIARKGKSLIFTCEKAPNTRYILAELGMTGLFLFQQPSRGYEKHIHLTLTLEGSQESRLHYWNPRRFGRVYLLDSHGLMEFVQRRFGADPFDVTPQEFHALIHQSRGRMKDFFLDQHKLAGIGNIYANEILFDAKVHPHARGNRLSRPTIARLYASTQCILKQAIKLGGSSIRDFRAPDGTRGQYQDTHLIYQKTGAPCPRGCLASINRLATARSSFYCQRCQKRS